MTDDKIAHGELPEKGSGATLLREMIGFAAHRLRELDAEGLCGAGLGERSAERVRFDSAICLIGRALGQG